MQKLLALLITVAGSFQIRADALAQRMPGLLNRIAMVESSGNPHAVGDGGRARGLYQFHARTWQHVTQLRRAQGQPCWPYSAAVRPEVAGAYARTYVRWIAAQLQQKVGHVTDRMIYGAWNAGCARFLRGDLPALTRRRMLRFEGDTYYLQVSP